MPTTERIARLRAKMIAKREPRRAAELLIAAGLTIKAAIGFVLDLLAAFRRRMVAA